MSLNYIKALEPVATYDPRIDFDVEDELGPGDGEKGYGDKYLVYRGPKNIEYFELNRTSGDDNTAGSTDFTYFMPSRESCLDRTIFLRANIEVDVIQNNASATNANVPYLQKGRFALQAFPLHHCIRVLQLQIDGNVYTVDLQNSFEHMKYYNYTEDELKTWSSLCPSLLDNASLFHPGTSYDVLSVASEKTTGSIPPRGAFGFTKIVNTVGTATVKRSSKVLYEVTEPVQLSPLIFNAINQYRSTSLTGLSNIKIKITWKQPQEAYLSGFNLNPYTTDDPSNYITTTALTGVVSANPTLVLSVGFGTAADGTTPVPSDAYTGSLTISKPSLLIGVLSMPDVSITPPINSYDFVKYETHTEPGEKVATGITFDVTSRNYNLSQIPHAVLLAVNLEKNGNVYSNFIGKTNVKIESIPDFYFGINKVNIKLGNRSGLLANCRPELLYLMNRNNGLEFCNFSNSGMKSGQSFLLHAAGDNMTAASYVSAPQGCPLLLRFGKDIAIDDSSLAPGCATNTNFQITLTCNYPYLSTSECKYQLNIIFIYQGIYTVSTTGSSYVIAPLTREDVLNSDSNQVDNTEIDNMPGGVLVGGSFLSKLKKIGKKAFNVIKNPRVQKLLRESINLASDMGVPGISQIDAVLDRVDAAKAAMGSGYRGGVLQSSNVVGGSMMSASDLRRRLGR